MDRETLTSSIFLLNNSTVPPSNVTNSATAEVMTSVPDDRDLHFFLDVVKSLASCYTVVLICAGCVCNTLSISVFSRRCFRESAMSLYLRFLSLMDLGAILTGLTRFFQSSTFNYDVREESLLSCHVNYWFMNLFLYSSSWTLVIVTTERVFAILKPHPVNSARTRTRTKLFILAIFLTVAVINIPVFYIFGNYQLVVQHSSGDVLVNSSLTRYCTVAVARELSSPIFWWLDGIIFAFLPSVILAVCNVIILTSVINSRNRLKKIDKRTHSQTSAEVISHLENNVFKIDKRKSKRIIGSSKETSLTVSLFFINIAFVVCNFPICFYDLGPHHLTDRGLEQRGDAIEQLLLMLMYTNNGLNFVLYCLTGSRFRQEIQALLKEIFLCRFNEIF